MISVSWSQRILITIGIWLIPLGRSWSADDDDERKPPTTTPSAAHPSDSDSPGSAPITDQVTLSPDVIAYYHLATAPVERRRIQDPICSPGRVDYDADAVVDISTAVSGRVAAVYAHVGDHVSAGDAVLTIDSADLGQAQNELLEREAARVAADADAQLAEATWARSRPLLADHTIAAGEGQRRENDLLKAHAAQAAAHAAVSSAKNTLRLGGMGDAGIAELLSSQHVAPRVTIRTPITGTIIARTVTIGAIARPDQEALLVIADTTRVWVSAQVPVSAALRVHVGDHARISAIGLPCTISTTVDMVPTGLDPESQTLAIRMTVPASSGLRPGMYTNVTIEPASDGSAPLLSVVPQDAVFSTGGGTVVFVPVADSHVRFRSCRVVTGPPVGGLIPVISGIAAGQQIVVSGGFIIKAELAKGPADQD